MILVQPFTSGGGRRVTLAQEAGAVWAAAQDLLSESRLQPAHSRPSRPQERAKMALDIVRIH